MLLRRDVGGPERRAPYREVSNRSTVSGRWLLSCVRFSITDDQNMFHMSRCCIQHQDDDLLLKSKSNNVVLAVVVMRVWWVSLPLSLVVLYIFTDKKVLLIHIFTYKKVPTRHSGFPRTVCTWIPSVLPQACTAGSKRKEDQFWRCSSVNELRVSVQCHENAT